jgi:hypothetical protein
LKKIASILLLSILLFNVVGYFALFAYEQEQAKRMVLQDMPEEAFKIVKVLASTYVHVADTDFDFPDEQFTIEGKTYHLAKKRIHHDTLEIYLLNNVKQDELTAAFKDYIEQNVLAKTVPSSKNPLKSALKDFLKNGMVDHIILGDIQYQIVPIPLEKKRISTQNDAFWMDISLSMVAPPPELSLFTA